jgi:type III secretion protein V
MNKFEYWLGVVRKSSTRSEVVLAIFIILVLSLMVFALPPLLLDVLIAINIIASIALLFLAVSVKNALALSTFPTLILLTTLFRLALNIGSSKQILLTGDAGHIIESFGRLVVGGSLLIGGVIFIIISLVQFIVVAKGAERVAEVSARFTLDGMPGKQMSIDADLRAGAINKDEARRKRSELEAESQFHGSMDGAMKFVKGDAIAAVIIAAVNVVAGMLVGTIVHDMEFGASLSKYSVLAIGDGMVSQIPSLLAAISAGLLVTRVSDVAEKKDGETQEVNLASTISTQIMAQPKTLLYSGLSALAFSIVPGFPWYVFLIGGSLLVYVGTKRASLQQRSLADFATPMPAFSREAGKAEVPYVALNKGAISSELLLEIYPDLLRSISRDTMVEQIQRLREDIHARIGLVFPGFRIMAADELAANSFRILIHDVPGPVYQTKGMSVTMPSNFSMDLVPWRQREFAQCLQTVTWDTSATSGNDNQQLPTEYFIRLAIFAEVSRRASELIGYQEAQDWLNRTTEQYPDLCNEFLRSVSVQRLSDVLKLLVADGIPIRNPKLIIEAILVNSAREKDAAGLTERVRVALGRSIYTGMLAGKETFHIALLEHTAEQMLTATAGDDYELDAVLGDSNWDQATTEIVATYTAMPDPFRRPTLVVNASIRRVLQAFLQVKGLNIFVMSKTEVPDDAVFQTDLILCTELHKSNNLDAESST